MIVGLVLFAAIKQRMEKDVDEVGKVARSIKSKIEELDREVRAHMTHRFCLFWCCSALT